MLQNPERDFLIHTIIPPDFRNDKFDLCLQKISKFGISIISHLSVFVSVRQTMSYLLIKSMKSGDWSFEVRPHTLIQTSFTLVGSGDVRELL